MEAAQQRYAADERVQLDLVADHFVSVFRDAELPFNKLLAEQPLPKVSACLRHSSCHVADAGQRVDCCRGGQQAHLPCGM